MGALAALAAVGAIIGTVALAATPRAKTHGHTTVANGPAKTAPSPFPPKARTGPSGSAQPFLADVQRLVIAGTINRSESQVLDREIRLGRVDTQTLAAAGFTQAQLQAVQQTLANTKRSMASSVTRQSK
jgi:hypothetical protein